MKDFKSTTTSNDFLIRFSLFVQGEYAEYSAFIHMTPEDYQKYFCKGRENEDIAACALKDWKDVTCTVVELSGYCSQNTGNVAVSILSREQICPDSFTAYEDDEECLWEKLSDKAGINDWQEVLNFREEIAANATSFISNLPTDGPLLIELYASIDENPFTSHDDSAVMCLADYRKYFCPAGVDPVAHAKELWDCKPDYYCYCDYELGATIRVFTYDAESIRSGNYHETESDDFETTLWDTLENYLSDGVTGKWSDIKKILQQNVQNLLDSFSSTVNVTYAIPKDKLDAINAYVESIGGTRLA